MSNERKLSVEQRREIGRRLQDFRISKHMTQEQFSELLGVSKTFYGQAERGISSLGLSKWLYLSDKLNADIGYILTGRKHYHIELPQGTTSIPEKRLEAIQKIINLLIDMP